jgi:hypothetical protein
MTFSDPPDAHPLWVAGHPSLNSEKRDLVVFALGRKEMVTTDSFPQLHLFNYDRNGDFFCNAEQVLWHRGCTGFDY